MEDTKQPVFFKCPRCNTVLRRPLYIAAQLQQRGYCDLGEGKCIKPRGNTPKYKNAKA